MLINCIKHDSNMNIKNGDLDKLLASSFCSKLRFFFYMMLHEINYFMNIREITCLYEVPDQLFCFF